MDKCRINAIKNDGKKLDKTMRKTTKINER